MPPLPEAIIRVLAPCAPLFSARVGGPALGGLVGALFSPGPPRGPGAVRVLGRARARHCTKDHRVLNRAPWSARPGGHIL